MKRKPNFFVLGAPKCGTTALASYLSSHPHVFMTEPKEPHHYNTDLNHGSFKDRDRYLALFDQALESHVAVGEASVWYLYSKEAVTNILADIPDARFIVMLRNPIDMVVSLHEQMVFTGYENIVSLEQAWYAQGDRREGKRVPIFVSDPKLLLYHEACRLGSQLRRLFDNVSRDKVLVILQEEMKIDPGRQWGRVQQFLDVPDDGRTEFPIINSAKKRKSRALKLLNDGYLSFRNRFNLPPLGTGFFEKIDRWNIYSHRRPVIEDEFRKVLADSFREEIEIVGELIQKDLRHWK